MREQVETIQSGVATVVELKQWPSQPGLSGAGWASRIPLEDSKSVKI